MSLTEDRRGTQRERLLGAMTEVVADGGYDAANIARVIAAAGVSRRTFYEQFRDKEDCFLVALLDAQERLRADLEEALTTAPPPRAWRVAIEAVLDFAAAHPARARVVMGDALAAGPRALDVRDQGIGRMARRVEDSYAGLPRDGEAPDFSMAMVLGGVYRMLAARLRRDESDLGELRAELGAWLASYARPLGEHRWRTLEPIESGGRAPRTPPLLPPLASAQKRGGLSAQQLTDERRQRILFAVAELAAERGYRASTLADIQRRAGVDAEEFHGVFADKREAFAAVHEEHFRHVTAVTAGAFFRADAWPERIWESGRSFARVMEQNAAAAHVGFVEVHAAGPRAVRRNEELVLAFTLFLREGYAYAGESKSELRPEWSARAAKRPEPRARAATRREPPSHDATRPEPPSPVALEAIAATNFEIAYHEVRTGRPPRLSGLLVHVTFLCLAPFLGPAEANRFIDGKLARPSERSIPSAA